MNAASRHTPAHVAAYFLAFCLGALFAVVVGAVACA